jgi:hypothetical protein
MIFMAALKFPLLESNSATPSDEGVFGGEEYNMNERQRIYLDIPRLPQELIDWLTKPITRFLAIEAAAGAVLFSFTLAALVLSNSSWAHPFQEIWETPVGVHVGPLEYTRLLREWINDVLMTLFFFVVALEPQAGTGAR